MTQNTCKLQKLPQNHKQHTLYFFYADEHIASSVEISYQPAQQFYLLMR